MKADDTEVANAPASAATERRLKAVIRRAAARVADRWRRRRSRHAAPTTPEELANLWEWLMAWLLKFGGATTGNSVTIFHDGDDGIEALWQAIAHAQHQVWFEMYIIEPDRVGLRTLDELTRAAQRGCEVILLYDAIGTTRLGESVLRPLRDAGARIEVFNPIWRWWRPPSPLCRDHRKIVIVDGCIGFSGGMNISEDYAGKKHGNSRFFDCHIRMEGPCVRDLATMLASSWRLQTNRRLPLPPRCKPTGETFAQVLGSRGWYGRRAIQRSLRLTIRHAATSCFITTPYFIPPQRLMRAIIRAAERGVDVRILTAGDCDVPIARLAAQHIYGALLRKGVRIYEMFDHTLHAKTIAIDGLYAVVGSFNLDTWSDKRNLELNIGMIDAAVAGEIQSVFQRNIQTATEVTLKTWRQRPWWRRGVNWSVYQMLRW